MGSNRQKGTVFETDKGPANLADLFRGRSQLLVYHFMFGPENTASCPACSAIADGFDGFAAHLEHHYVAMIQFHGPRSPSQAYKRRMGWTFTWASSLDTDFNYVQLLYRRNQRSGEYRLQLQPARRDPRLGRRLRGPSRPRSSRP